jgi:hypothetical protein
MKLALALLVLIEFSSQAYAGVWINMEKVKPTKVVINNLGIMFVTGETSIAHISIKSAQDLGMSAKEIVDLVQSANENNIDLRLLGKAGGLGILNLSEVQIDPK